MLKQCFISLLLLVVVVVGSADKAVAQDPQFTQFYANPLYLNPAFAGSKRCPRVVMNYRNQWPAISGTFVTYAASYDMHIDKLHGGLGVMFMADRAGEGTLNSIEGSLIYSYQLNVSRKFTMRFAGQVTLAQRSIDWKKLTFNDMIDPRFGFIYPTNEVQPASTSNFFADFTAGFVGYTENFFFGYSASHLTQPDEGFNGVSKLPMKHTAHVGVVFYLNKKRKDKGSLSPNILYQHQQDFQQLNYGFYFKYGIIVGGLWFRQSFTNADAFIVLAGIEHKQFKFGYSYDITVSTLTNNTAGSHEVSVGLQFNCRKAKKKFRAISCPSF